MGHPRAPKNSLPSLIEQAQTRQLPPHQHMDKATLDWIVRNRPLLPEPQPLPANLPVRTPWPDPAWFFAEPRQADTIHGVRHCARAAVLCTLLADARGASAAEKTEAVIAAAVHDCARIHDQDDEGHGERASAWFRTRVGRVLGILEPDPVLFDTRRIADAIALHDIPYEEFTPQQRHRYERSRLQVDLVKTADALDRYRLPKRKWWPQDRHLRLIPTPAEHASAFDLVVASETHRLAGATSTDAIHRAILEAQA
jgi:hypothetical protein